MKNLAEVVGIRFLDFQDKQNNIVRGYQVFLAFDSAANSWKDGREIIKTWIPVDHDLVSSGFVGTLCPGSIVSFVWTRYGKAVIVCE